MRLIEILAERLARDFTPARYGYWIEPDGRIDRIDSHEGHAMFLAQKFPKLRYDKTSDNAELYETALGLGWVRISAAHDGIEMAMQWYKLRNATATALIDLINGLDEKHRYYIENVGATFEGKREVIAQIRRMLHYQTSGTMGHSQR
jgi:hypothetical protein